MARHGERELARRTRASASTASTCSAWSTAPPPRMPGDPSRKHRRVEGPPRSLRVVVGRRRRPSEADRAGSSSGSHLVKCNSEGGSAYYLLTGKRLQSNPAENRAKVKHGLKVFGSSEGWVLGGLNCKS